MRCKVFIVYGALALLSVRVNAQEDVAVQAQSNRRTTQQIICEKQYINFAFGRVQRGAYVDHEGNIYSYAYKRGDQAWRRSKDGTYTEEELLARYSRGERKLIARIDSEEVKAKRELILDASRGAYSARVRRGGDQGTHTSVCYLYYAATHTYREIILRRTGDERYENLSMEAKTLSAWLDSLAAKRVKR